MGDDRDAPGRHHRPRQARAATPYDQRLAVRASQGMAVPFVETRHIDDAGKVLAWDGETMGELEVRGPWVAASYFGDEGKDRWTKDGGSRPATS